MTKARGSMEPENSYQKYPAPRYKKTESSRDSFIVAEEIMIIKWDKR